MDKLILHQNLDAVEAWRIMHMPDVRSTLTPDGLYDVVLLATGSKRRAEEASRKRMMEMMREKGG